MRDVGDDDDSNMDNIILSTRRDRLRSINSLTCSISSMASTLGPLHGPTQQNRGSWFRHIRCARAASHISANDAGRHACRCYSICHRRTTRIIPRDWPRGGRRGGMDHPHAAHPPLDRQRLGRRRHRRRVAVDGNADTVRGEGRRCR